MIQTTTVLTEIAAFLFGRKYYANILRETLKDGDDYLSSYIFRSREAAKAHRNSLAANMSYKFVETVSFRSRHEYINLTNIPK